MISMKARLMRGFMRNRHLLQGRLTRETIDRNTSITALREQTEEMAKRLGGRVEGVSFQPADDAPVYAEWTMPEACPDDRMVLYFHGGGFVMGSAFSHRGIVSGFAKRLGVKALTFDYSLAPEHPAPAAAMDGAAMYRYVLGQGYKPENIVFAGDSAGGGVALSTLLVLKDEGDPLPLTLRAGAAYATQLAASHELTLLADGLKPNDRDFALHVGAEYAYAGLLAVRIGYKAGYDIEGLTAGLGLRWSVLELDYAFGLVQELTSTHRITLLVRL